MAVMPGGSLLTFKNCHKLLKQVVSSKWNLNSYTFYYLIPYFSNIYALFFSGFAINCINLCDLCQSYDM